MNIAEEKSYIYSLMRSLMDERKIITDSYYSLKKRLDDLDELEKKGLDNISIKGYLDLHNENNKKLSQINLQRELTHLNKKMQEESSPKETKAASVIPAFEIAEQKYKDNNKIVKKRKPSNTNNPSGKGRTRSEKTNYLYNLILEEMKKRQDTAFNAKKMHEVLLAYQQFRDYNIPMSEFRTNVFYRVCQLYPNIIQKVSTGHYQYVGNEKTH